MSQWIPLMDYAVKNGVSLSTLRRYIKANKIPYRVENGRYLLREDQAQQGAGVSAPAKGDSVALVRPSSPTQKNEVEQLKADLRQAREEIAELKMLIALYEEQSSGRDC